MSKEKSITGIKVKKMNLDGVNKLAKFFVFLEKIKAKNMGEVKNMAIAVYLSMATSASSNLLVKEIELLAQSFNKSHVKKDAIKRHLILAAMLSASHIKQVEIKNGRVFNKLKSSWEFEPMFMPIKTIKNGATIIGSVQNGYLAVHKVIGRRKNGFGEQVNILEKKKIIDINQIAKIQIKKIPHGIRYLYIIPK